MNILGISAFYHDSAAAILKDGEIIAAAQEERFTRKKHDPDFPINAVKYCLEEAKLTIEDLDRVVFYDKPFLTFERLIETYLAFAPRGFKSFATAMPTWVSDKLFQKKNIVKYLDELGNTEALREKIRFSEHHYSHAASAYYPSPFDEAVILTMDGVGEWACSSVCVGKGSELSLEKEMHFPHSLGLLYSAFTYFCGFKVNSGEYKLMGLAPYGQPKYKEQILSSLLDIKDDGSFWLDQKYFDYCTGLKMTNRKFSDLFGLKRREPESELTQDYMDMAASVQAVTEEIMLTMTRNLHEAYGINNLCLAGGVALNCVANGKIHRDGRFKNIWIQPAAGDAGGALGCALAVQAAETGKRPSKGKTGDAMQSGYIGKGFTQEQVEAELSGAGAVFKTLSEKDLIKTLAKDIADQKAVGWFQGRMEFGPRALGHRSIIADPRSPDMQKNLNMKVKFRESFRPFAPVAIEEHISEWFDHEGPSPYMLLVAQVRDEKLKTLDDGQAALEGLEKRKAVRSDIPAITHVDNSARLQTVSKDSNPLFHKLLSAFYKLTGCPVLINTSFNIRGEPIVCTPSDAYRCFMGTNLDILVVGNAVLYKDDQPEELRHSYTDEFVLD